MENQRCFIWRFVSVRCLPQSRLCAESSAEMRIKVKIGIITFNSAHNYGAVLQAWALQEYLTEKQNDVNIINFRIAAIDSLYVLYKPRNPYKKKILNRLYHVKQKAAVARKNPKKRKKYIKFEHFIGNDLHTTKPFKTLAALRKEEWDLDVLITGSDQVWNGGITKGINPAYFLAFGDKSMKRISYAASIGRDEIPSEENIMFERYLRDIDYISVREQNAKDVITPLTTKDISVVLDPTLLLEREKYDQIRKNPNVKQEYIYVHNVHLKRVDPKLNAMAEELSKRLGLPIVHNWNKKMYENELRAAGDMGPKEFIGWIANASYVITNSFHATVFSIIYHRNLITIPHFKHPDRMKFFLGTLGIGNHLIEEVQDLPENLEELKIDYDTVDKIRRNLRKESTEFLDKALHGPKTPLGEETYFDTKDKFSCYGCKACQDACPVHAITMEEDKEGFWYPVINEETCIHCNLCRKVCIYHKFQDEAVIEEKKKSRSVQQEQTELVNENVAKDTILTHQNTSEEYPIVYAGYHKDQEECKKSTSGAGFVPLYEKILEKGGKVVGVRFNENTEVIYDIAGTREECQAFRGTKYVAADSSDIKVRVKELLNQGTIVLYQGNPCQIAGLKNYLRKDYPNLYTVEIICHGVPSPKVFRKYVESLEEKYNSKIENYVFRHKFRGWSKAYTAITFESGEVLLEEARLNNYNRGFWSNATLRPSCFTCEFANKKVGVADITIGDYWGVKEQFPELENENGVSLIKINSKKGADLFEEVKDSFILERAEYDAAYTANHKEPVTMLAKRGQLMDKIDDVEDMDRLLLRYNVFRKKK